MKLVRSITVVAFALALFVADSATARPGDLDPSFSTDGFAQVDLLSKAQPGAQPTQDPAQLAGIGPGGEIVLAANTRYGYSCNREGCGRNDLFVALARLLPNGELDTSFAGDGTFEGDFGLAQVRGTAYAVQPDGKVLVAGSSYFPGSGEFIARLNVDGTLDQSFDGDGVATFDSLGIDALTVAPDGRIIVGGSARGAEFQPGFYGLGDVVMRLLPDGTADPSFGGGDGAITVDLTRLDGIDELALDGHGRILAAGSYDTGDRNEITSLIRVLPDGSLDSSFSGDGSLQVDLAPSAVSAERVSALVIDDENRPILSISSVVTGPGVFPYRRALVRYTEDGSPDSGFGPDGQLFVDDVPDEASDAVNRLYALALDGQGRLLVGGGSRSLVGRRLSDGRPDPSFGDHGWIQVDPAQGAYADDLVVDPAGRVVVVGSTGVVRAQIARLRTDNDPPDDLDADGLADARDPCPSQFGPSSGCWTSERALTMRRVKSSLVSELSSASPACVAGAQIQLLRKKKGRDRRVATSPPQPDPPSLITGGALGSSWPFERPARGGRYYAKVPSTFDAVGGNCTGARSGTIRLGPKHN
jgi:uncharacterized delta-60 repeat protein